MKIASWKQDTEGRIVHRGVYKGEAKHSSESVFSHLQLSYLKQRELPIAVVFKDAQAQSSVHKLDFVICSATILFIYWLIYLIYHTSY